MPWFVIVPLVVVWGAFVVVMWCALVVGARADRRGDDAPRRHLAARQRRTDER